MSPRTGRPPKSGITRNKNLSVRLTANELERLQKCADKLNKSRTDTIMHGISLIEKEK